MRSETEDSPRGSHVHPYQSSLGTHHRMTTATLKMQEKNQAQIRRVVAAYASTPAICFCRGAGGGDQFSEDSPQTPLPEPEPNHDLLLPSRPAREPPCFREQPIARRPASRDVGGGAWRRRASQRLLEHTAPCLFGMGTLVVRCLYNSHPSHLPSLGMLGSYFLEDKGIKSKHLMLSLYNWERN